MVIIALATLCPPSLDSSIAWIPERIRDIGNSTPITPVLQTRTSPAVVPNLDATNSVISWASLYPCSPTHVLAIPALTTRPLIRPSAKCSWLTVTVGDFMVLVVNTPAALHGASEDISPRSSLSSA